MKKILLLLSLSLLTACSNVPISNRKQINLIPNSALIVESEKSYAEVLQSSVVLNDSRAKEIKYIGSQIQKAVEDYMKANNKSSVLKDFKWEFNLIEGDAVNAWCMPGGKVAFYTGILPYTKDANGIATVMGHEIAHAVANHGNERMSQAILINFGYTVFEDMKKENPTLLKEVLLQSYGIGSTLGILKFSRNQELEADKLGLIFMAMAGYDPSTAVEFWERMSQVGGLNLEILSTHPSDDRRIKEIRQALPEAMKYYKKK